MCEYDQNIKAAKVILKPGDVVKYRSINSLYTICADGKIYGHQSKMVLGYYSVREIQNDVDKGYAAVVSSEPEPKPEVKIGPGSVVQHSDGEVYTITVEDKYFSHSKKRVLEISTKASEHVKKYMDAFTVLV